MVLEPSGPPGPPRRTLESKTTFVAHPSGTILGSFSVVLSFVFAVFSRRPPELDITAFGIILMSFWEAFLEVFGDRWK